MEYLTHAQRRIWVGEKMCPLSPMNNIGGEIDIKGYVNAKRLMSVLDKAIHNNSCFGLKFDFSDEMPSQWIDKIDYKIEFLDLSDHIKPEQEYQSIVKKDYSYALNIEHQELYKIELYKLSDCHYKVYVKMHHIISDGWSFGIFLEQISSLLKTNKVELPKNDYMHYRKAEKIYKNSKRYLKDKEYWEKIVQSIPHNQLYNSKINFRGERYTYNISIELTKEIRQFCDDQRISESQFFVTVFGLYESIIKGEDTIVVGFPVYNRLNKVMRSTMGMFTSTVPIVINVDMSDTLEDLIKSVKSKMYSVLKHQQYPYDELVRKMLKGHPNLDSLFKITVNYYNFCLQRRVGNIELKGNEFYNGAQTVGKQVIIDSVEDEPITFKCDYKSDEYNEFTIKMYLASIKFIIDQIINNVHGRINAIELTKNNILKINSQKTVGKTYIPISKYIEKTAKYDPNRIAITDGSSKLTYEELNNSINHLAYYIKKKASSDIVAIMINHSIPMVISLLAVNKAGLTYLPVDLNTPIKRIEHILDDSKVNDIVIFSGCDYSFHNKYNYIDFCNVELTHYSEEHNDMSQADGLAYIIYTSGSTGRPKGVAVSNDNLFNYLDWAKSYYTNNDIRMPLYSSISVDLTVTSLFLPLITGGIIDIYRMNEHINIIETILEDNLATVVKLTPSHLRLVNNQGINNTSIKVLIVGGEDLKKVIIMNVEDRFSNITIYNEYGPTEATVGCIVHNYNPHKDMDISLPIGRPIQNTYYHVLSTQMKSVPDGEIGELYIGGRSVTKGYINNKELSKVRYMIDPYSPHNIIYKTGDMVKINKRGEMVFCGRKDSEIKLRGFRIDTREIENKIYDLFQLTSVVKVHNDKNTSMLHLFYESDTEYSSEALTNKLEQYLPSHMIPHAFHRVEAIPIAFNGKVELNKLVVNKGNEGMDRSVEVKGEKDKKVIMAIKKILGINKVDLDDNFYAIGGDSIKAIQISSILSNERIQLNLKDILSTDSIGSLLTKYKTIDTEETIDTDNEPFDTPPIGKWLYSMAKDNVSRYNQYVEFSVSGSKADTSIIDSVLALFKRYDSLRLHTVNKGEKLDYYPYEYIARNKHKILYHYQKEEWTKELRKNKLDTTRFDTEKDVLINIYVIKENNGITFLFIAHHLIVDGVSWRMMINDFLENILSENITRGGLKLYKNWTKEIASKTILEDNIPIFEDWAKVNNLQLASLFKMNLIRDISDVSVERVDIDRPIIDDLIGQLNKTFNLSKEEGLLYLFIRVIKPLYNQDRIIIHVENHGRNKELINANDVGWYTDIVPIEFRVSNTEQIEINKFKQQFRQSINKWPHSEYLKYLNLKGIPSLENSIWFNYLGDLSMSHSSGLKEVHMKDYGVIRDVKFLDSVLLELNIYENNKYLSFEVTKKKILSKIEMFSRFEQHLKHEVEKIKNEIVGIEKRQLSSVDFQDISLSDDDFKMLFESN